MATYELIALNETTKKLLAPTSADTGTIAGNLTLAAGDLTLSEGKLTITDTADEVALTINSSAATNAGVLIELNSSTAGEGILARSSSITTGSIAKFHSTSTNTGAYSIVDIVNDATAATGAYCLRMQQDAANAFMNLVGTAGANVTDPISTFVTVPGAIQGWAQVDINGTKRWIPFYADPVS